MNIPLHSPPPIALEKGSTRERSALSPGTDTQGMAAIPNGRHVYVPNFDSGSVSVINTADNTVVATIPVGACPEGVAVTPDGRHVYVPNSDSGSVSVIDTADNTVADTVPVSSDQWV